MIITARETRFDMNNLVGKPVTFEGREVGHVIETIPPIIMCSINSDIVNQLIDGDKVSYSLEVVRR